MATDGDNGRVTCPRCGQRLRVDRDVVTMEPGTEPLPQPSERMPDDPRQAKGV